jgi:DNA-binding response OmpR family regulator
MSGQKKLLIVEDDADVRLGYQVLLRSNNYETFFATDAVSAVSEALKQRPDLIILDLGLPAGDGFMVLDRFHAKPELASTPVIVVSGRDHYGNRDRAFFSGARAFVQKPWDDNELLALIPQLINSPRASVFRREISSIMTPVEA